MMRMILLASAALIAVGTTAALAQAPHAMRGRPHAMAPAATPDPAANAGVMPDGSAPPASAYRGGAAAPLSTSASHVTTGSTRGEIAPRLPDPGASANTPEAFLMAARRALDAGRTGAAQEALERAETRILTRSTAPSLAGAPDDSRVIQQIGAARRALGNRDVAGAKAAVAAAMAGG